MKRFLLFATALTLANVTTSCTTASAAAAPVKITVDASVVLNPDQANTLGVNTNILQDSQANRPAGSRSLSAALRQLNVKYLRYPGGEEADGYLWSQQPYTAPAPTLARISTADWPSNDPTYWTVPGSTTGTWAKSVYDFDSFMADCKAVGCQPVLVVAADGIYKPPSPGGSSLTRAQAMAAATAWVHYANVVKGYGIKYWEIGNETWNDDYMGANPGPVTYGKDVAAFSRAMKAVDPSIKIGANGNTRAWFDGVLSQAAPNIDFLAVHTYPSYGISFSTYQRVPLYTANETDAAAAALADYPAVKDRIFIAVTETGVLNSVNSMGSALINFTTVGDLLADRRVRFSMMWDTRWLPSSTPSANDALDPSNNLYPMGRAVAIWGSFKRGRMISATTTSTAVNVYASQDPVTRQLSMFVVNTGGSALTASAVLRQAAGLPSLARWIFRGTSPTDLRPTFTQAAALKVASGLVSVPLSPYSVTVLTGAPA